jgi:hypothetical protein
MTSPDFLSTFTAGAIAGISQLIVGHPFDTVKVWGRLKHATERKIVLQGSYQRELDICSGEDAGFTC